jgi:hypothetical protein
MKKTIIAALASLMLAGAISAVSSATSTTATQMAVIVGDGASPLPLSLPVEPASGRRPINQK